MFTILIDVNVEGENKEVEVPEDGRFSEIVEQFDYHLDSVVVLSGDEPVPMDEKIDTTRPIKIVSVVSGG